MSRSEIMKLCNEHRLCSAIYPCKALTTIQGFFPMLVVIPTLSCYSSCWLAQKQPFTLLCAILKPPQPAPPANNPLDLLTPTNPLQIPFITLAILTQSLPLIQITITANILLTREAPQVPRRFPIALFLAARCVLSSMLSPARSPCCCTGSAIKLQITLI